MSHGSSLLLVSSLQADSLVVKIAISEILILVDHSPQTGVFPPALQIAGVCIVDLIFRMRIIPFHQTPAASLLTHQRQLAQPLPWLSDDPFQQVL